MTVKEIIEIENGNESCINLYKEGIFWRTYNQSAMRLVNNLKTLKINRKYVKKVGQDIFYCGFPDGSLEEIKKKAKEKEFILTETGNKKIIIMNISEKDDYKNWMENQQVQPQNIVSVLNEPAVQYTKINGSGNIIQQIQQYPLENVTPLETMLFVQKLKQSIKDGSV